MAEIINLRTRRKQAARETARAKADANAAQHGLSKAQKELAKARSEKSARELDGHKRDPDRS
ncbi:DUF4169 family protein [Pararhodobacter marinus]|uniref:DUF4169 family protein n=1 Tax=Pararhodobacter marinus TaxID=2184063 RepID=UPI003515A988